jgi:hypothetical protein
MSTPQIAERPGGGNSRAFENVHGQANTPSVPHPAPAHDWTAPSDFDGIPDELKNRVAHLCMSAYDLGRSSIAEDRYLAGWLQGRQDEEARSWDVAYRSGWMAHEEWARQCQANQVVPLSQREHNRAYEGNAA